jgi:hypothetical protein
MVDPTLALDDDVHVLEAGMDSRSLHIIVENEVNLPELFRKAYHTGTMYSKVLSQLEMCLHFQVANGLVWTKNQLNCDIVCIPQEIFLRGRRIIEMIIDHAHQVISHFGQFKTSQYVHQYYWWPNMSKDITVFCNSCNACQVSKVSNQRPHSLLHALPIFRRPWESVGINFMEPLLKLLDFDYLMVVIDCLTSLVHLILTNTNVMAMCNNLAWVQSPIPCTDTT